MARYKQTDNSQGQFIAVNLQEQLLPDTFEWTIDYLINKTDISLFDKKYNNDQTGAAAYSPKVLLKIILALAVRRAALLLTVAFIVHGNRQFFSVNTP
jgi:transposase